jgi:hypothetical protein
MGSQKHQAGGKKYRTERQKWQCGIQTLGKGTLLRVAGEEQDEGGWGNPPLRNQQLG